MINSQEFIQLITSFSQNWEQIQQLIDYSFLIETVSLETTQFRDSYLKIKFTINKSLQYQTSTTPPDSCLEPTLEYADLPLITYEGEIHVLLHPVYQIPAPYLRAWNSSGQPLTSQQIQTLFSPETKNETSNYKSMSNEEMIDHRIYIPGSWEFELHPFTNEPYYTLHLCEIHQQLTDMISMNLLNMPNINETNNEKCDQQAKLIFINWLSLIGKYWGMTCTPTNYQKLFNNLYPNNTDILSQT